MMHHSACDPLRGSALRGLAAVLSMLVLLTGCAQTSSGTERQTPGPGGGVGPATARVNSAQVRPVAENPSPRLPASVVDVQGSAVTVDDASRILALDLYGTTSRIVFELGLGGSVGGARKVSDAVLSWASGIPGGGSSAPRPCRDREPGQGH